MLPKEGILAYAPHITPKRYKELIAVFGSLESVWNIYSAREFKTRLPWPEKFIGEFLAWRDSIQPEKIEMALAKENIRCITRADASYPPLLKEIYDPPICLFVRGKIPEDGLFFAVVGSRKYSSYGKQAAESVIPELVKNELIIVSGLALGIDSIAHAAAMDAGGKTIAVIASGIDKKNITPKIHTALAERIIERGGAIISEYAPGTEATTYTFPERNRIIAGMSMGTLVVEAAKKSGALITATVALEENREVFAIPHNITNETSAGGNMLIKNGATIVTDAYDIITALNLKQKDTAVKKQAIAPSTPAEAAIIPHLSEHPVHVDILIKASGLTSREVGSTLTMMEMKGMAKNVGGMMYIR